MSAHDFAAGHLLDELRRAVDHKRNAVGIDAALEPPRRLRSNAQTFGGAANRQRIEMGALDEHVPRVAGNFRIQAAHDAGEGNRAFAVADQQIILFQRVLFFIQRLKPLSRSCPLHDDF